MILCIRFTHLMLVFVDLFKDLSAWQNVSQTLQLLVKQAFQVRSYYFIFCCISLYKVMGSFGQTASAFCVL